MSSQCTQTQTHDVFAKKTMAQYFTYSTFFSQSDTPPTWRLLHWAFLCMAVVDVACLFLGKVHYTVDVVLGYWIGTR